MSKIVFKTTTVSKEKVAKYLEEQRFSPNELALKETKQYGMAGRLATGVVPFKSGYLASVPSDYCENKVPQFVRTSGSGHLRVEEGWMISTIGQSRPRHVLFFALEPCSSKDASCSSARDTTQTEATKAGESGSKLVEIASNISVSRVLMGDVNQDGLTDALVVLSNGAGILLQQSKPSTASKCKPKN